MFGSCVFIFRAVDNSCHTKQCSFGNMSEYVSDEACNDFVNEEFKIVFCFEGKDKKRLSADIIVYSLLTSTVEHWLNQNLILIAPKA